MGALFALPAHCMRFVPNFCRTVLECERCAMEASASPHSHSEEDSEHESEAPNNTAESSTEDQCAPCPLPPEEEKIRVRVYFDDGDHATIIASDWSYALAVALLIQERLHVQILKIKKL
jgi:hypothetical protein